MAKEDLKPVRSKDEAKKRGSAGGKKSGETRRKQKLLKDTLLAYLKAKPDGKKTVQEGITEALIEKALMGDTKAYEIIRDTIGQKPADKQQLAMDTKVVVTWEK